MKEIFMKNKKNLIFGALAALMIFNLSLNSEAKSKKKSIGGILGAVVGGVIGSQFGKGDGKTAATIIGTIAGSLIGSEIGEEMDEADRRALRDAQHNCFNGRLNEPVQWHGDRYGSRTGAYGEFVTVQEGYRFNGDYCREYHSIVYTANRTERRDGIACSRPDGSWYESNSRDVRFN